MVISFHIAACFFFFLLIHVDGQTIQDEKDLREQLFTTYAYDFRIRPVINTTDAVNVNVTYYMLSLNELNEKEEVMKTTGFLYLSWTDSQLQWNTSSYGDLAGILVPQGEVWKPDIALKNSFTDFKQMGTDELNVYIYNDGSVSWYPMQVFQSTCSVDITYYPFDVQLCELKFVAWSYVKAEVDLKSGYGLHLYYFEESPTWNILETSVDTEENGSDSVITFSIKLKRRALYTMLSIVFPVFVLSILNLFVFVLPCESGEKSGFAVTVFLAFAVFMTLIEATMPENSTSVAIFSIYLILMTAQSTVVTMIALGLVRCSTFEIDKTPIPGCVIKLASIGKCKPCRKGMWASKVNKIEPEEVDKTSKVDLEEMEANEGKNYTWKQVVNGLDVLCFVFFTIFTFLVTVVCLSVSAGFAAAK